MVYNNFKTVKISSNELLENHLLLDDGLILEYVDIQFKNRSHKRHHYFSFPFNPSALY